MSLLSLQDVTLETSVPILVAGGGACGLVSALAAREAGHETVVIESASFPRGSTSMSLGAMCAVGTADQRRHGIEDDADIFAADVRQKTRGTADLDMARAIGTASGEAVDWLARQHDVVMSLDTAWLPAFGHSRMRMHVTPGRSGADLMDRLLAACDRAGIPILTNATLTDLIVRERQVAGIRYSRPGGSVETIGCDALILATSGFGGNRDMIARHIPDMADARYFGWENNRGDGIWLGAGMGALLSDMDAYQGLGLLADPAGIDLNPRFLIEGGIQVNKLGKRFSNELDDVSGQGARVLRQPGGQAWVIYDQRIHRSCFDLPQYVELRHVGGVQSADTLYRLAEKTGIDAAALAGTLLAMETGQTDEWGRHFDTPPLAPPFHAVRVTGALFHTQGGLEIDRDAHVLDPERRPFPNLFAGGGTARGISGTGPSGYLPGAGLCSAIALGYVAGRASGRLCSRNGAG